ncbi:flagellar basal body protein FliL [Paenibacillus sp. CAA11]|uniref:flagellar basal body-associated FliL family protein n=1 Tax=Paenibacillus sp. CAA11 TaxID=1532905 RepID=UPI000D3A1262|nr:flagellar basal body-associated FliL family protein [Paenibacillus sp. CAA11]AWB44303.1 flagellar basal body protein FliL [Paenibacillus sp. CAA11]
MKKMAPWLITILLSITLIVLAAFLVMNNMNNKNNANTTTNNTNTEAVVKKLTAEEIVKVTSVIEGIKTNLSDPSYLVKMDFAFQLNDEKAKEAFDQIAVYKVKPIIIKTLADSKPEELNGAKGKDQLCAKLLDQINKILPEGNVIQVEITDFQITQI